MRSLTFRERDMVSIGPDGDLTEEEAESIARLSLRLPNGALSWGHRALRFGPFCGVIQTPQMIIELFPKIESGPQAPEDMRGLLVGLLARAGELGPKRVGEATLGQQSSHLLDVFIEDFCDQVKTALRGGAIARYTEKTENLNAIRGRLELTDHLRANAFDRSRLLCRFDERSIDNGYNRALKAVLRVLHGHALSPRTRAIMASILHRFDDVANVRISVSDLDALRLDRTITHWQPVFRKAAWLLAGLFPDLRIGDTSGSALLFNMERLFETVLGQRIRRECQAIGERRFSVGLQRPQKNLATSGFQLRPDITVLDGEVAFAIFDAKWKRLEIGKPNAGVSSADAYQMNAYADRYCCNRLALVYPATAEFPSGSVTNFVLLTATRPVLEVLTIDVRDLAFGSGLPPGFDAVLPSALKRPQSPALSFFATV
ncbi:5-methylcytosine-specific restriction enzyme subunit McrC [Puniceibacterium sediminis]|uniref:5-methylcytosine-specific restriction enzyme subunit McrC n=2 Tax=Puniceibacterium sediminis TaxID=1608407 RepID=A0A238WH10_9RHOB|nr:5-methylcytosine-specific restriction enzyme subunit McrC [Puniceibacterium sediminis]